jgi:hypothetical protein
VATHAGCGAAHGVETATAIGAAAGWHVVPEATHGAPTGAACAGGAATAIAGFESSRGRSVAATPTCASAGTTNAESASRRPSARRPRDAGPESTVSISILLWICEVDRLQCRSAQRTPAEWGPASVEDVEFRAAAYSSSASA